MALHNLGPLKVNTFTWFLRFEIIYCIFKLIFLLGALDLKFLFVWFQRFWIDSVSATPAETIVVGKSLGLTVMTVNGGEWHRRDVTWLRANGCLIIPPIHCTMSQSVRTCRTNWRVTSMGGLIWGTSIGGGNPTSAIWRGTSSFSFSFSCWFQYSFISIEFFFLNISMEFFLNLQLGFFFVLLNLD